MESSDRKYLRGLTHGLKPIAHVGKAGVTDGVVQSVDEALATHELVKVRFLELKEQKDELSLEIAERTHSERVGLIGHLAILFRQHPEEEKRRISLPSAG